jgi:hypothetical protein
MIHKVQRASTRSNALFAAVWTDATVHEDGG